MAKEISKPTRPLLAEHFEAKDVLIKPPPWQKMFEWSFFAARKEKDLGFIVYTESR